MIMFFVGAIAAAIIVSGYIGKVWNPAYAVVYALVSAVLILFVPFGALVSLPISCVIYPIAQRRKLALALQSDVPELSGRPEASSVPVPGEDEPMPSPLQPYAPPKSELR